MAIYYSDLYTKLLANGFLEPGEKILERSRAQHAPWYSKLFFWLKKDFLLVATTRRFIVFTHKCGLIRPFGLTSAESIPWNGLAQVKPSGMMGRKLQIQAQDGRKSTFKLKPVFVEHGSRKFSVGATAAWEQGRALPASTRA